MATREKAEGASARVFLWKSPCFIEKSSINGKIHENSGNQNFHSYNWRAKLNNHQRVG